MAGKFNKHIRTRYERDVNRAGHHWVSRRLKLTNPEVIRTMANPYRPDLGNLMIDAINAGAISDDEADDLEYTDIVMRGSDPDGNLVHVLIEVAFIIQETDIKRAARRADILERTVAGPTRAVVIGEYIFPEVPELADREPAVLIYMTRAYRPLDPDRPQRTNSRRNITQAYP